MFDINPNMPGVFGGLLDNIINIMFTIFSYVNKFWTYITTRTVDMFFDDVISDGFFGDIIEEIIDFVFADYFLNMFLWEFLLFGGIAMVVILNLYRLIK